MPIYFFLGKSLFNSTDQSIYPLTKKACKQIKIKSQNSTKSYNVTRIIIYVGNYLPSNMCGLQF